MIVFNFILNTRYEQWHNDKSFKVLEYEGDLEITINSTTFFSEPHFIILEFLRDAHKWVQGKTREMIYNSIETEDNPLIYFTEKDGNWYVQSPWQKYECDFAFTRNELEIAVLELERSVNDQINMMIRDTL